MNNKLKNLLFFSGGGTPSAAPDGIGVAPSAWWEWFDQSTLFTDAGTTPAAYNDLVYQMNDKSGNNRHRVQATEARRPTNAATGLVFDGTNHGMGGMTTGNLFSASAKTLIIAFELVTPAASVLLFGDVAGYCNTVFQNPASTTLKTLDRKSTRLNSSHHQVSRMPSSA
jgi:hypothetical protein